MAGTRMVVTPGMLRYSAQDARTIIRHELTHVATIMQGKDMPSWLSEGVAEYTAFRVVGRPARRTASRPSTGAGCPGSCGATCAGRRTGRSS